jgi:type IV pilus assembly protein PilW
MNRQKGLSLVELMIAITIGVVLMTGVVQMFVSSKGVFTTQQGMSRIQETGRLAIDFLARDIRQAGFMGCSYYTDWSLSSTLNSSGQFGNDFSHETSLRAYDANALPAGLTLNPAPVAGTQVIAVYTANDQSVAVSKDNSAQEVFVKLTTPAGAACPSGICADDIVAVADCDKAMVFQATAVTEQGNEVALAHTAGADPGNSRTVWGGDVENMTELFTKGAELFKLNTVVYYIAEGPRNIPGLYQKISDEPAYQLLQGVENINLAIGVDTDADRVADSYVAHTAVGDWSQVVAARVDVLVQTPDDNTSNEPQTYQFAGNEVTAEDRRIRQVFSTTIGIRSRLP